MTNKKNTRRALVMSVISLILCCAMLVGTTFAWFTDSVTSGNNIIQSGNLDIRLFHSSYAKTASTNQFGLGFGYSEKEGQEVDSNTQLFLNNENKPILWEPGATVVENFRIKNDGSLALQYEFRLQIGEATKTPHGKDLTDAISLYIDKIVGYTAFL